MATFHGRMPAPPQESKTNARRFSRSQIASMVLSGVLFLYSLLSGDIALAFLTASFLLFMLLPLVENVCGETCGNVMKGMAMGMGVGALMMAFF